VHKEVLVARGIIDHATVRYPAGRLDAGSRAAVDLVIAELGLAASPAVPVAVRA
jgi:2-keto-3-deoxy-L-arabinonate dehydratase